MSNDFLEHIKWTSDGLVPAIAQDSATGRVLMMAWMNKESLIATVSLNEVVYWSRSRQKLWHKGETSGHTQKVKSISIDCDGDVVLLTIEQTGGIACHTGRESCFYRTLENSEWVTKEEIKKDPQEIYR